MNELHFLIERAVRDALDRHDGDNLAVLLSGGIDSSTVASFAPELPAITGYYQGEAYDERSFAQHVANGREWLQVEITPLDFIRVFDKVAHALKGLRCGPGAIGQYVVAERAADEGIDVLFSGEGGDELFGGYARLYKVAGWELPDGYENLELPDDYPGWLGGALAYEWNNLHELCQVDERVAGMNDVKVVAPLLDPWVVAYAMNLPSNWRLGKVTLKEAVRGIVPDAILDRTDKRGFPVPFVEWAQNELRFFFNSRIGYLPDPAKPWDRTWWYDMLDAADPLPLAA